MWFTRLYVDPTKALMGQSSKKRLISLPNKKLYNMRGYSSLFIIITSKDSKQSFKKSVLDLNSISQHSMLSWNYPPPPLLLGRFLSIRTPPPPISNLFLLGSITLPPLVGIGTILITTVVVVVRHPSPPCPQTWRAVLVWATKRRYFYPITLANTVHDIESSPQDFRKVYLWGLGMGLCSFLTQWSETPINKTWQTTKTMRSANDLYIATITPLCRFICTPPPLLIPLEGFIDNGNGDSCLDAQPNSRHIYQTSLPIYPSSLDPPVIICRGGGDNLWTANTL